MKKIQLIIFLATILFITSVGIYVFQDEKEVLENEIIHINEPLSEIRRDKSEIIIDNFTEEFSGFRWVSNDTFVFNGNHKIYGGNEYFVDLADLSLRGNIYEKNEEELHIVIEDKTIIDYEVLYDMSGFEDLIFIKDEKYRGIYSYNFNSGEYIKITEAMKCNSENSPYLNISSDLSKLVYVEDEKNRLVTYNFENGKKRIIMREYSDELFDGFDELVSISSDGGYICVINNSDSINEMNFSVIGADSGNFYSDYINGISPNFSNDNNGLYYIYAGEIENESINDGIRIGYIDFETRKISYKKENENNIYNKIYAVNDSIMYITGNNYDEGFLVSNIVSYNFQENKRIEFKIDNSLQINENVEITRMGTDLIVDNIYNTTIIKLIDGSSKTYMDLEPISVNGSDPLNIYFKDDYIIFKDKEDFYKVSNSMSSIFYSTQNEIQEIQIPVSEDKAVIFENENGNSKLIVTYNYNN